MIKTIFSAKKIQPHFSKIILLFSVACFAVNLAFAQQRSIDWEVISISPVGNVENNHSLPLHFKFRNHGPDTWEHGDSVFYMLYSVFNNPNHEDHVDYVGMLYNSFQPADSGVTLEYQDPYQMTFHFSPLTAPMTFSFCVKFFTRAQTTNGDSLILSYTDPDSTNDFSCQQVTVYPDGSTAVSDPNVEDPFVFSFFPNPASDRVTLWLKDNGQGMSVTLTDITGRQVLKTDFDSQSMVNGSRVLDIARFPNGIYLLHAESGGRSATKKLVIQH